MRAYLICEDHDSLVGMRLAGISGCHVHTAQEAENAVFSVTKMKDVAILAITEKAAQLIPDLLQQLRERNNFPLVVEIPDRFGSTKSSEYLTEYVREAIGVKM